MTNQGSETGDARPIEFGVFMPPIHNPAGSTALQLERDLELIELLDRLGFAEAWVGEHLSNGWETIASPELFLAAAAQRTSRIRLGTGVTSLPYHHPFTVANRMVLLDHLSHGRAMLGIGPGQSPSDAAMMGIDHAEVRRMMHESAEAVVALLRGETVTQETDWFTLKEARLQVGPYNPDGLESAVASVFSPSGSTLAGRLGLGLLSVAASDVSGFEALVPSWENLQHHAAENGHVIDRSRWRVMGAMHLAETTEQAHRELEANIIPGLMGFQQTVAPEPEPWMLDPALAIEQWTTQGLGIFGGLATVGTPDDGIAAIQRLIDKTGGFGNFMLFVHNAAPWEATKRSLELFAEYVMPAVTKANALRTASQAAVHGNIAELGGRVMGAIEKARAEHGSTVAGSPWGPKDGAS